MDFVFKSTFFRVIILTCLISFSNSLNFCAIGQPIERIGLRKIVIDPGHGGSDPGTVGSKTHEKEIALSIALKLGSKISSTYKDVEVTYTRKDDKFVPLDERTRIANAIKADLFISIHCNANPSKGPYGTETYVLGLHKSEDNLDVAMRENSVVAYEDDYSAKYEGYDPKSSESFIIFSLMQNAYLDQSLKFANSVQTEFREQIRRFDRGVKQAGFLVLWKTSMPSVLIEAGFLSNNKEETYLATKEGQENIANAIFTAFSNYKTNIDNKSSIATIIHSNVPDSVVPEQIEQGNNKPSAPKVLFKVQIRSSKKRIPLLAKNFKNYKGVEEILTEGLFRYTIGSKNSYSEIVEYCQIIKKKFPDAFVIALKEGKIIPIELALKELSL